MTTLSSPNLALEMSECLLFDFQRSILSELKRDKFAKDVACVRKHWPKRKPMSTSDVTEEPMEGPMDDTNVTSKLVFEGSN